MKQIDAFIISKEIKILLSMWLLIIIYAKKRTNTCTRRHRAEEESSWTVACFPSPLPHLGLGLSYYKTDPLERPSIY